MPNPTTRLAADADEALDDRRSHQRTPLSLHGSYRDPHGRDHACMVVDVSPGGARILASDMPELDGEISVHLICVGRLTGRVVRIGGTDFGIQFSICDYQRERLARSIAWQFNRTRLHLSGQSQTPLAGESREQTLTLASGETVEARVTDVSLSGVAYTSTIQPPIGERVQVGTMSGAVVRHFADGFAVSFDPPDAEGLHAAA